MGDQTSIEWTDATWNPVTGCDRISPGCDHCYALKQAGRLKLMGQANYQNDGDPRTSGPGFGVTCHPHMLDQPLRWKRPRRIFVNSMSDLFHRDVPTEFIAQVFAVMACASQHTFQVLTKRPQRMAAVLRDVRFWAVFWRTGVHERTGLHVGDLPLPNVWLGTSIESDQYTWRANHLRETPAAVRFISAEPLLGPLPSLDLTGIDWLIVGGESGPGARPMHPDWVRDLRDRCQLPELNDAWPGDRHTRFHFKQWGEWKPVAKCLSLYEPHEVGTLRAQSRVSPSVYHVCGPDEPADHYIAIIDDNHAERVERVGKRAAGRNLDGRTWDEFPTVVAR